MALEATTDAMELRLRLPTGFINHAALATGAAGVARVYEDHGHARQSSLVDDELAQLLKRSVSPYKAHLTTEAGGSLPDTLQVFQRECLAVVVRLLNDCCADGVVHSA